jgi:hypothetical protein
MTLKVSMKNVGESAPALAYPIEDVPDITGVPRTKIFGAVKTKQLTARKAGRSTIIEHTELVRYIKSLPFKGKEPAQAKSISEPAT